jgi:uncharacterized damage-inducible protein DinB
VSDLTDTEMVLQPTGAPNHPAWRLGHVIHSWQAVVEELGGAAWLPAEWESIFGYGSSPADVGSSAYASRATLVGFLDDAANRVQAALEAVTDAQLQEQLRSAESREIFATRGDALLQVLLAHSAFHAGQLATWRRAIGRGPAAVFI